MRIFMLEVKKIIRTRVTWILLLAALLLSGLMAYIPVTFEGVSVQNGDGERTAGIGVLQNVGFATPFAFRSGIRERERMNT